MGQKLKIFIAIVIVAVAALAIGFSTKTGGLFKGQILNQQPANLEEESVGSDLSSKLSVVMPTGEEKDIKATCTISNLGPGSIDGKTPFKYAIYVNGKEVFSNVDSYTKMEPGDSFSFTYTIPREKTPDTGKIKFTVDTESNIDEGNKDNNSVELDYAF